MLHYFAGADLKQPRTGAPLHGSASVYNWWIRFLKWEMVVYAYSQRPGTAFVWLSGNIYRVARLPV